MVLKIGFIFQTDFKGQKDIHLKNEWDKPILHFIQHSKICVGWKKKNEEIMFDDALKLSFNIVCFHSI